jgi:hypothetical protein
MTRIGSLGHHINYGGIKPKKRVHDDHHEPGQRDHSSQSHSDEDSDEESPPSSSIAPSGNHTQLASSQGAHLFYTGPKIEILGTDHKNSI